MKKVLLATENLFSVTGGGQSFYESLIRANKDILFYHFSSADNRNLSDLSNVVPISLSDKFRRLRDLVNFEKEGYFFDRYALGGAEDGFLYALDMAASTIGYDIDIIDIPDFVAFGAFLPACMSYVRDWKGITALSMHGTISDALTGNWNQTSAPDLSLCRHFENMLYNYSDIRYGISQPYIDFWASKSGLKASLLDYSSVVDFEQFAEFRKRSQYKRAVSGEVDLIFVGRQELWKGPDIFLDLVSSLPKEAYGEAQLIGPPVEVNGIKSEVALDKIAKDRFISVKRNSFRRLDLWSKLSQDRAITIFPSRKDTFNLSALESILLGAPAMISRHAGVCEYLDFTFPGIPVRMFYPEERYEAQSKLRILIENYDQEKDKLLDYLEIASPNRRGRNISDIYGGEILSKDHGKRSFRDIVARMCDGVLSVTRDATVRSLEQKVSEKASHFTGPNKNFVHDVGARLARSISEIDHVRNQISGEKFRSIINSDYEYSDILARLSAHCYAGNRSSLFFNLADWEEQRGNDLLYATYVIRGIRLGGLHDSRRMAKALRILNERNFVEEARAAELLYVSGDKFGETLSYIQATRTKFRSAPKEDFTKFIDKRGNENPTVSVIVSIYNAEDKIAKFIEGLRSLSPRTIVSAEFILVDSNSSDGTMREIVNQIDKNAAPPSAKMSILYVRTRHRETIQKAWNRGIGLARGKYLAFLGVDEMVRPDAFDVMSAYLDENPLVDWVQGTAIVTNVDARGAYVNDIMPYTRTFTSHNVQLLDTCYIGYVGALYRKSIHDKAGFYDDSFRAAGDTEFKNRAWPCFKATTIPECLGTFLNYPDERTTHSPTAELEDLRAWYIYRTPAGLHYTFDGKEEEAVDLFFKCLKYKKSYMDKDCSDIELAHSILAYLRMVGSSHFIKLAPYATYIEALRRAYQNYDNIGEMVARVSPVRRYWELEGMIESVMYDFDIVGRAMSVLPSETVWDATADNRFHQHQLFWPSKTMAHDGAHDEPHSWEDAGPASKSIELGDAARDARDWAVAARHYRSAVRKDETLVHIWVQLGHALKEGGNRRDAEAAYRKALELDRRDPDIHLQLGHLLKLLNRKDEAKLAYLEAIRIDHNFGNAISELIGMGMTYNQIVEFTYSAC